MKYELFKVKRGKEILGEYILTDMRELMETGVLLPTDLYKSMESEYWLPISLSKNEEVRRAPSKRPTLSATELKLQRQVDTLASQSLYLTSQKHKKAKRPGRR